MVYGWPARLAGLVLAGLVAACLATPPDEDPARASAATLAALDDHKGPAASATTPVDWSQGDCLSQLRSLQRTARDGSLGPDEQPPFAVDLVAPTGSWLEGVPDLPIEVDLPLALADGGSADARCVLRIGPARDQRAAHRAVDLQDVHSAYQSSLRSERNPDYDAAHLKLSQAKAQARGKQKIIRTNDPLLDLIGSAVGGAIATFDARSRRATLDEAAAELAATPRSRDKPVYRPYSFERVVVRAQKQALVPVALLDAQGRTLQATELRQSERREFFLLRGLDPRDRDYEQHRATSMTRADLARWSRTPPALRLSSVALALTEGTVATDPAPLAPNPEPADATLDSWLDEDALADQNPGDPWLEDAFAAKAETAYGRGDDLTDDRGAQEARALPIVAQASSAGERGYEVGDLLPGLASDRMARPAPALGLHPSVVAIRAGSAAGYGFYVRNDMVLTTQGLVGSISVVDVTTADGATVPALVAAVDPARDLALLQVPRPGPPVILHDGPASAAQLPNADRGPGRPLFEGDRVIGMTTAAGQGVIAIDAIRGFLTAQAGVLATIP